MGTSLVVQWLRLRTSGAGEVGSTPGRGTKIPDAMWPKDINFKNRKLTQKLQSHPLSFSTATLWGWWLAGCISYFGTLIPTFKNVTYKEVSVKIVGKRTIFEEFCCSSTLTLSLGKKVFIEDLKKMSWKEKQHRPTRVNAEKLVQFFKVTSPPTGKWQNCRIWEPLSVRTQLLSREKTRRFMLRIMVRGSEVLWPVFFIIWFLFCIFNGFNDRFFYSFPLEFTFKWTNLPPCDPQNLIRTWVTATPSCLVKALIFKHVLCFIVWSLILMFVHTDFFLGMEYAWSPLVCCIIKELKMNLRAVKKICYKWIDTSHNKSAKRSF